MSLKMNRGKNQVMYSYLPGYTFDFDKSSAIAQIDSIRGIQRTDLNLQLILQAIRNQAAAWGDLARTFVNSRPDQFVLLEPKKAYSKLFPKVFWCQNRRCGQVFDYSWSDGVPNQSTCPICKRGKLTQLRFVRIHQCGEIKPLTPLHECNKCKTKNQFALDTRGSERISQFVWVCRKCGSHTSLFAGYCGVCNWEAESGDKDKQKQQMSIEVHRANRVFYPHYAILLNQPGAEVNNFLGIDKWQVVMGGFFMELSELANQTVKKFVADQRQSPSTTSTLSSAEIAEFKSRGYTDEHIKLLVKMQGELAGARQQQLTSLTPDTVSQKLTQQTGLPEKVWMASGHELLEAILPLQSNQTQDLLTLSNPNDEQLKAQNLVSQLGLAQISLVSDFPMTHVTFGFSRGEYTPRACRLNPFPPDREQQAKFPLFVDTVQADAIIFRLDPQQVWQWLEKNSIKINLPTSANDVQKAKRAHFVQLFTDLSDPNIQLEPVTLNQTLTANHTEARMVFGLLHTMSHLLLKKAALLCGLDRTSLAEYVLPRALMFAIYSNHRFGATIGALSSLFEQSLPNWLEQVMADTRRCIYDPVCQSQGGSCHACTHLAETSCRFFNLNLGRPFLFGGHDAEIGLINYGYWNTSLNQVGKP